MSRLQTRLGGILDGHIVLSRALANQNHFPAIDILESVSRCMDDIVTIEHRKSANHLKTVYATYKESEDMINIGAYTKGSSAKIDFAISAIDKINEYLRQDVAEDGNYEKTVERLFNLLAKNDAAKKTVAARF